MKTIEQAVNQARQTPTIENIAIADQLLSKFIAKKDEDWVKWLRMSAQIFSVMTEKFKANSGRNVPLPRGNLIPPADSGAGISGISPKAIRDPKARKEYEDAIAENGRNGVFWSEQGRLENMIDMGVHRLGALSTMVFEQGAAGNAELRRELKAQNLPDEIVRQVIELRATMPQGRIPK